MATNLSITKPWSGSAEALTTRKFKAFTERNLEQITQLDDLSPDAKFEMQVVASVLPFRVNQYVETPN